MFAYCECLIITAAVRHVIAGYGGTSRVAPNIARRGDKPVCSTSAGGSTISVALSTSRAAIPSLALLPSKPNVGHSLQVTNCQSRELDEGHHLIPSVKEKGAAGRPSAAHSMFALNQPRSMQSNMMAEIRQSLSPFYGASVRRSHSFTTTQQPVRPGDLQSFYWRMFDEQRFLSLQRNTCVCHLL